MRCSIILGMESALGEGGRVERVALIKVRTRLGRRVTKFS